MDQSINGRLEAIWIKRAHRGPMDPQRMVTMVAGSGIEGNADQGGRRQVTIIERELWERHMRRVGASVDPSARRANLMLTGVRLKETRGRILTVGSCRIRILGETRPCERMDEAHPGLREVMKPDWGGGVYGEVLDDGLIQVGDTVQWYEDPEADE